MKLIENNHDFALSPFLEAAAYETFWQQPYASVKSLAEKLRILRAASLSHIISVDLVDYLELMLSG